MNQTSVLGLLARLPSVSFSHLYSILAGLAEAEMLRTNGSPSITSTGLAMVGNSGESEMEERK